MPRKGTKEEIAAAARRTYWKHRDARIAKVKVRYEKNKIDILAKARVRYRGKYRDSKLAKTYGVTKQEVRDWLAVKFCEICEVEHRRLTLDHDHKGPRGIIRGRLCEHCNRGLGLFGDNPDTLEAAARYLRDRQEKAS